MHATYSPEDNKLRLYSSARLDPTTYATVKEAGFSWAPKQELFVAPMWTPGREDLLMSLCDEIGDEDTSLVERSEQRAERFDDYSDNRSMDAERAHASVSAIAENIPFGQPILIGHHSERHARKDAQRIENGMRKAVKMWEQAEYWKARAAGALAHAKYKERPDVRARRIKTIEAAKRKQERSMADATSWLAAWSKPGLNLDEAKAIAGYCWLHLPRKDGDRPDFSANQTAYGALNNDYPNLYAPRTLDEVVSIALNSYPRTIAHCQRWIAHYENRLAYERAMLAETGGTVSDKTGPEVGGAVQCLWAPRGGWAYIQKVNKVTVTVLHQWNDGGRTFRHNEPLDKLRAIMTKAQVEEKRAAGLLVEVSDNRGFILLDAPPPAPKPEPKEETPAIDRATIQAMKDTLKAGVTVSVVPQLFPTPVNVAVRMVELAGILPGHRILEPSAGTGVLLGAMGGKMFAEPCAVPYVERDQLHAVEINQRLADRLETEFPLTKVHRADFLQCNGDLGTFDRILMNPPFINGSDIQHIQHAAKMLKPGGVLVAICANGSRQNDKLRPMADSWEELPDDTFKEQGTGVRTVLLTISKEH